MTSTSFDSPGKQERRNHPLTPEWLTVAEACEFARCSKPLLYKWMNRGLIKNVSIRDRGRIRGYRRVGFDSLRAFLETNASGGAIPQNK